MTQQPEAPTPAHYLVDEHYPPLPDLRALAAAADKDGQHIYTHWRDSNAAKANEAWHKAASPELVVSLLDRIAELEAQQARKYRLLQRGEAMCLGDQFIDDDTVTWHPVWKGLVLAGACWFPSYQPMRREIQELPNGPTI